MCIQNVPTKGGENEFADGFHVAEVMRRDYPEEFRILTNTPVQFVDIGTDYYQYHKLHSSPTIEWVYRNFLSSIICIFFMNFNTFLLYGLRDLQTNTWEKVANHRPETTNFISSLLDLLFGW